MRIKLIQLGWFRGSADPVALEPLGKSMVVYGANGTGKSSFVDAVEYAITDGKISHLSHEYSGRNQERAIPNTHTPADRTTEFGIEFVDDSKLNVQIARSGTHVSAGADHLAAWDYRRTVLRQDEVAEFIRSRKGEKYSALLPLFGLHELEVAAENLRQLPRVVDQQSKLEHKRGTLQQTTGRRRAQFGDDTDEEIEAKIAGLHATYCPASGITEVLARCRELETVLDLGISTLSTEMQRYLIRRQMADTDLVGAISATRSSSAKLAGSVEPLVTEKLSVLQSADAFAAKLKDGADVACPACGLTVPVHEFKAHVKGERDRLRDVIVVFEERKTAISILIDRVKSLKTSLARREVEEWVDELKRGVHKHHLEWIEQYDPEGLRRALSEDDLQAIEDSCLPVIAAADESSRVVPPEIGDLAKDKTVVEIAKAVFEAGKLAHEVRKIDGLVAFLKALETGVREEIRERSETVITEISDDIGEMWKTLHPGEPIENVRLYLPEDDKAIDVALRFHGKDQDSPRLTLSEGYRNSLGLCIFLALAKREAGADRPLLLDDVVVSLDRNHRGMIVQLLEDEFAKRQVLIFTHDRDWYAELRQQLDEERWIFGTLLPYESPSIGIRWSHKTTTFDDARAHLRDRPDSAGNDARKIMDVELALIAEKLKLRLPYLRGDKNDKRMCLEFLERLTADGKKSLQKKSGAEYPTFADGLVRLEGASRLLVSWGNRGSHSTDVVRAEATKLIGVCEKALEVFRCVACRKNVWLADASNQEWVQCQCGELRWRYGKS